MVNVMSYGATGNGVTDDTAAFQTAINTGHSVYAPKATYKISGTLTLGTQLLYGDGIDQTILKASTGAQNTIAVNPLYPGHGGIRDLSLDNSVTPTSGSAIKLRSGNFTISNVRIKHSWNGIEIDTASGVMINNLWNENYYNYGLWVHNSNDVFIQDFIFNSGWDEEDKPNAIGIRLSDKVEAFIAQTGDVLLGKRSLETTASSYTYGNRPAYNRFTDVYFDSANDSHGVFLDKMVMTKFTNCWFSNRPGNGCFVGNTNDISFVNCEFANSGQHGCLVDQLSKRTKFDGCSFNGNSASSGAGVCHGLAIGPNTTDFEVINCTATNSGVGLGTQGWGVIINSGSSNRYSVVHNLVSGNATGGVSDAGTGAQKTVGSNF